MKTKTSRKTKSDLPGENPTTLKLADLKPKKNPKGGITDGTSNTILYQKAGVSKVAVDPSDP